LINIVDEFKQLYKQVGVLKETIIYFPSINLTIAKDRIIAESVKITESICESDNLKFGSCKSSQIEFTVMNVDEDLKGLDFIVTQNIGEYIMLLGTYKADSCEKQDDLTHKKIVAYDSMTKLDIDVAPWYNGLFPLGTESYTLSQFRTSFLTYFGLVEDTANLPLPNDTMTVTKTIEPSQISGRVVSEAIEEINGSFGHIGRDGSFKHIVLKEMHNDYPQDDYPTNDYPLDGPYDENIYQSDYRKIKFEEYRVAPIDKLQIRQEENDVGCIVGTGTNAYVIQGNFLVYGKSASELEIIANNASINIFNRGYRPYTATQNGLPYLEVGDFVWYNADDSTAGYVFERTLTGIQALQDEFSAKGSEEHEQTFGVGLEIIQQKGRMAIIEKSVEGVRVIVSDLDEKLTGEINVLAGQVVLKVDSGGNIGYIDLLGDPTGMTFIKLKADSIEIEGLITLNGNFKVLLDGTIEAVNAKFSGEVMASTITSSAITVNGDGIIMSEDITPTGYGYDIDEVTLTNGVLTAKKTRYFTATATTQELHGVIGGGYVDFHSVTGEYLYCTYLNGSLPLTSSNFLSYFLEIKDTLTYPVAPHVHPEYSTGGYATSGDISTLWDALNHLSQRVGALE
jgi:hypothetical protein